MNILPIKLISELDQPIFGVSAYYLGRLDRSGFNIPSGIVICPPEILLQTVLKHFDFAQKEVFEQRIEIIRKEISHINLPFELEKETKGEQSLYYQGEYYSSLKKLWQKLLEGWLEQLKTFLWAEGFNQGLTNNLLPQVVFFVKPAKDWQIFTAYYDPDLSEVVIKNNSRLEPSLMKEVDHQVLAANKKLFLPQVYEFLLTNHKLFIIKVTPFTQTLPASKEEDIIIPKNEQKRLVKSSIKLFLNLSSGFAIETNVDGVLIEGEKVTGFDETVFKLTEAALTFPQKPVIYKLPDILDGDVRGTMRLLHQPKLLKEVAGAYLFSRNKKSLFNLDLAIPLVRNYQEYLEIKRELSSIGITRKSSLKLWLEVAVPDNIISLEDYLEIGVDGLILDLDHLQKLLGGHDFVSGEYYKKEVDSLLKFIHPIFKILHQEKIPLLIKGELSLHPEILDCLIERGAWGVVVNSVVQAQALPEHLNWAEKRIMLKKFSNPLS